MGLIPERLAKLREQRGLSQRQLGGLVGTNQQTIGRYETGERSPKVDMVAKLADALAPCTVSYLIGRSPIPEGTAEDLSAEERDLIAAIRAAQSADEIDALVMRAAEAEASKRRKAGRKR
jgi:transcriptional regulator with XRE-family HTH domain